VLQRRLKRLEQQLQTQTLAYETQLAFVQERHKKRVEALDELNAILLEFDHAVGHVRRGHTEFVEAIDDYSAKARAFARKNDSVLGSEMYVTILEYTDLGRAIRDASYCVTDRTIRIMAYNDLPPDLLARLQTLVGTKHLVRDDARTITSGYSDDLRLQYHRMILGVCELSEEFNELGYVEAKAHFGLAKDRILRTLPIVPQST